MHEFSTAQKICGVVLSVASERRAKKVVEVELLIGSLTFLNLDQLKFCLELLFEKTIADGAKIKIETSPPKIRCNNCGFEGVVEYRGPEYHTPYFMLSLRCPKCDSEDTEIIGGKELLVKSIKVVM
ncbi:MAG: hydrogenase maturation nickel metallochaperone HypA [Candidatus Baldrarchaeia archaeon]|mgnify:CR=1 FL=1